MQKPVLACLLITALSMATAHVASAQTTDTFMLVPNIPGDSADARHKDWIDVLSLTQSFDATAKGGSPCTVAVMKSLDKAGPLLWAAAVSGQVLGDIKIEILKAGEKPVKFYDLVLFNARIAKITTTPDQFYETLSITGTSATLTYTQQKPDGSPGQSVSATVNCR